MTPRCQSRATPGDFLITDLSDEDVREFQTIMREESMVELSFEEAKARGVELIRLFRMFMDRSGHTGAARSSVSERFAPPLPEAMMLPVGSDHQAVIKEKLERLEQELRLVKHRPTAWRYALVALWDALAHALVAHRPSGFEMGHGFGALTRLFRAIAAERPELPQVEKSIEAIDDLRTRHIHQGVTRWPVALQQLPGIFLDCLRVIQRLESDVRIPTEESEALIH